MIKAIISILFFVVLFYFVGSIVLWLAKHRPNKDVFSDLFTRLIVGLVATIVTYSMIQTRCNTISFGFVILLICHLWRDKSRWHSTEINSIKDYFVYEKQHFFSFVFLLFSLIVFFSFRAYFFYNEPYNNEVHFDYFCYSALGDCMVNRGVESLNCVNDLLCEIPLTPTPYHYFDIWLAMLIAIVGGITTAESMFVETFAILSTLYAIGLIAIVRCYSKSRYIQLIAFSAVLLGGIVCVDTSIGSNILKFTQRTSIVAPLCNTKTIAMALFMSVAILAFVYDRVLFYYVATATPLVCITLTPAVYSGLGCMMLCDFFFLSKGERKNVIKSFVVLILMALFILGFYFFQGDTSYAMNDFSFRIVLDNLSNNLTEMLKSVVKYPFFFLLYHFVFVAIIVYLFTKSKESRIEGKQFLSLGVFMIIMETVAFLVALCYKGNYDSFQFLEIPTLFLAPIYVLLFAFSIRYSNHIVAKIGIGLSYIVLLVYSIWSGYYQTGLRGTFYNMKVPEDVAYIQSIENEFNKKARNRIGVGIRDVYDDAFPYRTRVGLPYQFCPQIPTLNLKAINICTLASIRKEWDNEETRNRKANNTFTRFAENYIKENGETPEDVLQLAFCKQNNIEFMIVVDGQKMPEIFEPYIDTVFCRPNTTEKFVFLNQKWDTVRCGNKND